MWNCHGTVLCHRDSPSHQCWLIMPFSPPKLHEHHDWRQCVLVVAWPAQGLHRAGPQSTNTYINSGVCSTCWATWWLRVPQAHMKVRLATWHYPSTLHFTLRVYGAAMVLCCILILLQCTFKVKSYMVCQFTMVVCQCTVTVQQITVIWQSTMTIWHNTMTVWQIM